MQHSDLFIKSQHFLGISLSHYFWHIKVLGSNYWDPFNLSSWDPSIAAELGYWVRQSKENVGSGIFDATSTDRISLTESPGISTLLKTFCAR